MQWKTRQAWRQVREWVAIKIAWALPREVVTWAFCRAVGYATTGQYENTVLPEITASEALGRWMGSREG